MPNAKLYVVPDYRHCSRCPLAAYRHQIVFGRGDIPSTILFIGEAPGKTENTLGQPFVGQSGKLLDIAMSEASKLSGAPIPKFFITNIVACRPTDSINGDNREPNKLEVEACLPRLRVTIGDVNPRKVILLGKVAKTNALRYFPSALCLNHPAYILRKGGPESPLFQQFVRDLSQTFREVL